MSRSYRFITGDGSQKDIERAEKGNFVLIEADCPEIFFQLVKVLRAKAGDEVILQPQKESGPWYEYRFSVASAKGKEVDLKFISKSENRNELGFMLNLVLCIPNRPDKLDFILQKAVELGVNEILLAEGDFSQFKHQLRTDRLEKIVREAAEQSERAIVPEVQLVSGLQKFLKARSAKELETFLAAMERQDNKTLPELLPSLSALEEINIIIGPEGGFSDIEKQLIKDLGIKSFTLGKRILRMETAAVLSLGIAALR